MSVRSAIKNVYRGAMGEDDLRPALILKQLQLNQDWTDSEKNEFVEEFWAYTNNPHKNADVWREIFSIYPRVHEVRKKYGTPTTFTVFRGGNQKGFSWTTSIEQANYFRERNIELGFSNCLLWKGVVHSDGILFESDMRDEKEFVLRFWDEAIWVENPFAVASSE